MISKDNIEKRFVPGLELPVMNELSFIGDALVMFTP